MQEPARAWFSGSFVFCDALPLFPSVKRRLGEIAARATEVGQEVFGMRSQGGKATFLFPTVPLNLLADFPMAMLYHVALYRTKQNRIMIIVGNYGRVPVACG
jgi:hypothetical protein